MAEDAVDGQADQLAVEGAQIVGDAGEGDELGGAYRGEVGRVAEEDHPLALVVPGEGDRALGGLRLERRRRLPDEGDAGDDGAAVVHGHLQRAPATACRATGQHDRSGTGRRIFPCW